MPTRGGSTGRQHPVEANDGTLNPLSAAAASVTAGDANRPTFKNYRSEDLKLGSWAFAKRDAILGWDPARPLPEFRAAVEQGAIEFVEMSTSEFILQQKLTEYWIVSHVSSLPEVPASQGPPRHQVHARVAHENTHNAADFATLLTSFSFTPLTPTRTHTRAHTHTALVHEVASRLGKSTKLQENCAFYLHAVHTESFTFFSSSPTGSIG